MSSAVLAKCLQSEERRSSYRQYLFFGVVNKLPALVQRNCPKTRCAAPHELPKIMVSSFSIYKGCRIVASLETKFTSPITTNAINMTTTADSTATFTEIFSFFHACYQY